MFMQLHDFNLCKNNALPDGESPWWIRIPSLGHSSMAHFEG
jgi:hypothetical protein